LLKELPHLFSANEVSERIVSSSVGANLIIYFTTKYHLGAASSAIIIFVYIAAANFLPVCGAIVSDALLGRCLMVTLTLFSCTIVRALNNPLALKQLKFIIFQFDVNYEKRYLILLFMFHSGDYTFVLDIGDYTLDTAGLHPTKPRLRITYSDSATCVVRLPWFHGARSEWRPPLLSGICRGSDCALGHHKEGPCSPGFVQLVLRIRGVLADRGRDCARVLPRQDGLEGWVHGVGCHHGVCHTPELGGVIILREGEATEEHVGWLTEGGCCYYQEP